MPRTIRFLNARQVRESLPMPVAIAAMKEAFIALSRGKVTVPRRLHLDIPQYHGVQLVKPAYFPQVNLIGIKMISLYRDNMLRNLPFSHALMLIFDAGTGIPLAIMDGDQLTAIRTGAASGLATDLLAGPGCRVAAIFGAGVQARFQLEALLAVRSIQKVYIFDPDEKKVRQWIAENKNRSQLTLLPGKSPPGLEEAQIICTATTSSLPVFSDSHVSDGVHINAIGAFQPNVREIPAETVRRARVFVDQREACLAEAGDLVIPIQEGIITARHLWAEIGEVAAGSRPGRRTDRDITLFKSVGNAIQDLAAAHRVWSYAREKGIGTEVEL